MHSLTGVIVPSNTTRATADNAVGPLLAPHCEVDMVTEEYVEGGWWDWWQVGGRYTGRYSEYNPHQDPLNMESCPLCLGTGERIDGLSGPGNCNGCCRSDKGTGLKGYGSRVKWPSQWAECPDDVVPVKVLLNNPGIGLPLRVVFPDGTCTEEGPWADPGTAERDAWDEEIRALLEPYAEMAMVVVDVHV